MAPADAILRCQNKVHMYDTAVSLGIPTAAYVRACYAHELHAAVEKISFPCVIKPLESAQSFVKSEKALICESMPTFNKQLRSLPEDGNCPVVVQRFVKGHRRNCHFIAKRGRVLAYFEQKVFRTDHADGTGRGVDSISVAPTPELVGYTARLVEDLHYSCVGTSQFLFKEDTGEVHFLEINPRFDSTIALPYQCGYDLPLMALQAATQDDGPRALKQGYQVGKRVHWFMKDAFAAGKRVREPGVSFRDKCAYVGEVLKSYWNSDCHMVLEWSDPMPTLHLCAQLSTGINLIDRLKVTSPRRA
jgi:biotin carboxylase